MESSRIVPLAVLALALVFPGMQLVFLALAAVLAVVPVFRRRFKHRQYDKNATRALLYLSSLNHVNEAKVAETLSDFEGYRVVQRVFERTGKLKLPYYGWRSRSLATALKLALQVGSVDILARAAEKMVASEASEDERQGLIAGEKYTLMASCVVAAAVLGVVNSINPSSLMLYYVAAQSVLASLWLYFVSGQLLESLSFLPPLALLAFTLATRLA